MLDGLDEFIEVPQDDVFKIDQDFEIESEISENCQKMMSRIQKELYKKDNISFNKLTKGQQKSGKWKSFIELLHLKRKNKIDLSKLY